jgi:hypothetical protein
MRLASVLSWFLKSPISIQVTLKNHQVNPLILLVFSGASEKDSHWISIIKLEFPNGVRNFALIEIQIGVW